MKAKLVKESLNESAHPGSNSYYKTEGGYVSNLILNYGYPEYEKELMQELTLIVSEEEALDTMATEGAEELIKRSAESGENPEVVAMKLLSLTDWWGDETKELPF